MEEKREKKYERKKQRKRKEEKDVCIYIKERKKKIINKAPRVSRCIRSFKRIQDQDPYSSFQPCAIR
jgi:hypothetical protein